MYYCELCGTFFDEPFIRRYKDPTVDSKAEFQEVVCPVCLEPHIERGGLLSRLRPAHACGACALPELPQVLEASGDRVF